MRAADIPSRVVLGYQGGEVQCRRRPHDRSGNRTRTPGHEVWLARQSAGRRVDPTAAVAPDRIEMGIAERFDVRRHRGSLGLLGARALLSTRSHNAHLGRHERGKWNEWILGYGPENQNNFMRMAGHGRTRLAAR